MNTQTQQHSNNAPEYPFTPFNPDGSDMVDRICPTCGMWHSLEAGEHRICECGAMIWTPRRAMVIR